ncbi:MAG TPA: hypothetical protein DIU00_14685 [Phycisphaerales bacterium]|nr:hypothetical protein [Phycisphaerales bacterium]
MDWTLGENKAKQTQSYLAPRFIWGLKTPDLKKQTQFVSARIGANSFLKGIYGNMPVGGGEKNKANQSQFASQRALKNGRMR